MDFTGPTCCQCERILRCFGGGEEADLRTGSVEWSRHGKGRGLRSYWVGSVGIQGCETNDDS